MPFDQRQVDRTPDRHAAGQLPRVAVNGLLQDYLTLGIPHPPSDDLLPFPCWPRWTPKYNYAGVTRSPTRARGLAADKHGPLLRRGSSGTGFPGR